MDAKAYLLGVLHGDGCVNKSIRRVPYKNKIYSYEYTRFVLDVADKDFAEAVSKAFKLAFGVKYKVQYRRGYYWVESHSQKIVNDLKSFRLNDLKNDRLKRAYLKGLFDSEGSVNCDSRLVNHVQHVVLYNSNHSLLMEAKSFLLELGITASLEIYRQNPLFFGLVIRKKGSIKKFAKVIGFSIKRKQELLNKVWNPRKDKRFGEKTNKRRRLKLICKNCSREFKRIKHHAEASSSHFCSRECYNEFRKKSNRWKMLLRGIKNEV